MMNLPDIKEQLSARFPPGVEQYRTGPTFGDAPKKTIPLAYIDARAVFDRLDEVCPGLWETELEQLSPGVYKCRLAVCGVARTDVGQAGADEGEKEKSGASDAIKRAAVQFGIGRYLYDLDLGVTELVQRGNKWDLPKGWKPGRQAAPAPQPTSPAPKPERQQAPTHSGGWKLTDPQLKRMYAILKQHGLQQSDLKNLMSDNKIGIGEDGLPHTDLIPSKAQYDNLCDRLIPAAGIAAAS